MKGQITVQPFFTGIGLLIFAAAIALILLEVKHERDRRPCPACGSRACDGACADIFVRDWSEREAATIAKLERHLATSGQGDTLEPWRELLESL